MDDWMIKDLEIENFKSIKHAELSCERINILIGKPNVGKSNILEALSLFSAPYSNVAGLKDILRYEEYYNLFYDNDTKKPALVLTDKGNAALVTNMLKSPPYLFHFLDPSMIDEFKKNVAAIEWIEALRSKKNEYIRQYPSPVRTIAPYDYFFRHTPNESNSNIGYEYWSPAKRYIYSKQQEYTDTFTSFLKPPKGENLFSIIQTNSDLREEISGFIQEYGYDLLYDPVDNKFVLLKREKFNITKIPYSLIADTFQRFIFHLAAIVSNSNSILLFEEPEAHSFPQYVSMLASRILDDKNNQYFIATQSPYLLNEIMAKEENAAIFIVSFEDFKTTVKKLTREEKEQSLDYGIDFFLNLSAFEK